MLKKLAIGCALLALLAGTNYLAYRNATGHSEAWSGAARLGADSPPLIRDGAAEIPWPMLERTKVDAKTHAISYSEHLKAVAGKKVRLTGVLCVLPNLVTDGKVQACVLLPPSKMACCGITCEPRPELMVFVDCKAHPFAPPAKKSMAVVIGELELQNDDSSWCLYTLNGAQVTLLP